MVNTLAYSLGTDCTNSEEACAKYGLPIITAESLVDNLGK